ncbi:MAG: hypothetical protein EOP24_41935 [Hyphomicrobiales bacterium]|nr:MAG: hypothetical protein EOP24_41935 [Hyphomicrobiales bacterium]
MDRFVNVLSHLPGSSNSILDEAELRKRAEALACMAEECAFVRFAQEKHQDLEVSPEKAAQIVTTATVALPVRP